MIGLLKIDFLQQLSSHPPSLYLNYRAQFNLRDDEVMEYSNKSSLSSSPSKDIPKAPKSGGKGNSTHPISLSSSASTSPPQATSSTATTKNRHQHKRIKEEEYESDREYLFPFSSGPPLNIDDSSHSLPNPSHSSSKSTSPKPLAYRRRHAHSISMMEPVRKSTFESLPKSPASEFLRTFAASDDLVEARGKARRSLEDGCRIDKYTLGKVIGRGSFSECREATPTNQGEESNDEKGKNAGLYQQKVAMKIINERQSEAFSEFDKEIEIWRMLKHPNILPLIDCLHLDDNLIAITPVAERGSLLEYLNNNGPVGDEQKCKQLFRQIASALEHLHEKGIIHRDLKLDNILLDESLTPYVCDFGLSEKCMRADGGLKDKLELSPSDDGMLHNRSESELYCKGSLWYLAPEEIGKFPLTSPKSIFEVGCKSDVWALGVVLYALVTGSLPFTDDYIPRLHKSIQSGNYPKLPPHCSSELCSILDRLLTVDYRARPTVKEILADPWLAS